MPGYIIKNNFTAGEFSPRLYSRTDFDKYNNACKTLQNFYPLPQGGITKRPGTKYIAEVKTSANATELIPFRYSNVDNYILEFGNKYIRFYKDQAQVVSGTAYELGGAITGTHTGGNNESILTDSTANWQTNAHVGKTITNSTDSSSGVVYANTATTVSAVLSGGTDNDWDTSDAYSLGEEVPWLTAELPDLDFTQSADVLYITHPNHHPYKLERLTNTSWRLSRVDFYSDEAYGPFRTVNVTNNRITPSAATGTITLTASDSLFVSTDVGRLVAIASNTSMGVALIIGYTSATVVDARVLKDFDASAIEGTHTSVASSATVLADNTKNWATNTHVGKTIDNVTDGSSGTITSNTANTVTVSSLSGGTDNDFDTDDAYIIASSVGANAEWYLGAFSETTGWPAKTAFHQQRLIFANTSTDPFTAFFSRSGSYENFNEFPLDDIDTEVIVDSHAFQKDFISGEVNYIQWLRSGKTLMVGTIGDEFTLGSYESTEDAITPTAVFPRPATSYGSSSVRPVRIGDTVIFVQSVSKILREYIYSFDAGGYTANDLSILSEHLLKDNTVKRLAHQQYPTNIIWVIRDDGILLGASYLKDQGIIGWHYHSLGGDSSTEVERIAVIPGVDREELWMIVKRTVDGGTVRYVELLEDEFTGTTTKASRYFDCHYSYSGSAATTITGLDHLEGESVHVLADGVQLPSTPTVSSGAITLASAVTSAVIGYNYNSDMQPIEPDINDDTGASIGRTKRVNSIYFRLLDATNYSIGTTSGSLAAVSVASGTSLFSGIHHESLDAGHTTIPSLYLRHSTGTPITISSLTWEIDLGQR